ncbi:MAG: hypothetical protein AB7I18_09975 [Candidatus Berkiella sp.]
MLYFLNRDQKEELLSESSDFIAGHFKDGVDVHCLLALAAALNGNRSDLDSTLEKVSAPFKRDAYLLSAFYAAKRNHADIVFQLLKEIDPHEHWDVAAIAYCYGHEALSMRIGAQRPQIEDEELLMDVLVPSRMKK